MRTRLSFLAAGVAACCFALTNAALAQAPAALTGQISSAKEGAMEGVVVSAKKAGGTVTISVVSDDKGHYAFPASKLEPGQYAITIRAVGYELDGPKTADVKAGAPASADIKLKPVHDLSKQLTNAEWLLSAPGSDKQKEATLGCISCHDLDRIIGSMHTADEFMQIFDRMSGYYPGSTPSRPQRLVRHGPPQCRPGPGGAALAEWYASVNLSQDETWNYPLKTLPRPTGRATHVVVTEYDLPRKEIQPHDVIVDKDGMVWFSHFGQLYLGSLNPKTGEVKQYAVPPIKAGFPIGTLDLETTRSGDIWLSMMYQGGVARFDKATGTFQTWSVPQEWQTDATQQAFVSPNASDVDGKVWVRTPIARRFCGSIPKPGHGKILARSRIPQPAGRSSLTASRPIPTTTCTCSTLPRMASASSTRAANWSATIPARFPCRVRVVAASTIRVASGTPNMAAMRSAC